MSDLLPWMTDEDIAILEFLHSLESDEYQRICISPKAIYLALTQNEVTDKRKTTLARRLRLMTQVGLAEKIEGTFYYRITDLGVDVVHREHNPEDLIPPEDFEGTP
jgi:hypothetical protein